MYGRFETVLTSKIFNFYKLPCRLSCRRKSVGSKVEQLQFGELEGALVGDKVRGRRDAIPGAD